MKHDINNTALVPYIIADKTLRKVIESDSRYNNLQPVEVHKMVEKFSPSLVVKAETFYQKSEHFRNAINKVGQDCREQLAMFIAHWSLKLIDTKCQN